MYRLARRLGYTVRDLTDSLGWDELVTWMAFEDLEPAEEAANVRAARLAYYAAHAGHFGDRVRIETLLPQFGVGEPAPQQTLSGLAGMLEALGGSMPDHVRERFKDAR